MDFPDVPRIPFLAQVREEVLRRSLVRRPKWGFRLAPDFVMQLQPAPKLTRPFAGRAFVVFAGTAPAVTFKTPLSTLRTLLSPDARWIDLQFVVACADRDSIASDSCWTLKPCGVRWNAREIQDPRRLVMQRLWSAFTDGTLDQARADLMLSPQCLICGRALTDPASMARWIGPNVRAHPHSPCLDWCLRRRQNVAEAGWSRNVPHKARCRACG